MKKIFAIAFACCMVTYSFALTVQTYSSSATYALKWTSTTAWTDGAKLAGISLVYSQSGNQLTEAVNVLFDNTTSGYSYVSGAVITPLTNTNPIAGTINNVASPETTTGTYFLFAYDVAKSVVMGATFTAASTNGCWFSYGVPPSGTFSVGAFTTVVPEPTALALLALGVAGLALKRKVA